MLYNSVLFGPAKALSGGARQRYPRAVAALWGLGSENWSYSHNALAEDLNVPRSHILHLMQPMLMAEQLQFHLQQQRRRDSRDRSPPLCQ